MKRYKGHIVECGCDRAFADSGYEQSEHKYPQSGKYSGKSCPICRLFYWYYVSIEAYHKAQERTAKRLAKRYK